MNILVYIILKDGALFLDIKKKKNFNFFLSNNGWWMYRVRSQIKFLQNKAVCFCSLCDSNLKSLGCKLSYRHSIKNTEINCLFDYKKYRRDTVPR